MSFFKLYGRGKLDLKLVHGMAEKQVRGKKISPRKVHTSEAEIAEENNKTASFRENDMFICRHICLGKQLLPQINICCREVMQNNKMTFLMSQPLLDACSILEKRPPGSRVVFEF